MYVNSHRPNLVGVIVVMATSFKSTCAHTVVFRPLTPQQATVDPCLRQSLLDTHRQVRLSLLWGHCSYCLAPRTHKVLSVPSKILLEEVLWKFHNQITELGSK